MTATYIDPAHGGRRCTDRETQLLNDLDFQRRVSAGLAATVRRLEVGLTPHAWAIQGCSRMWTGEFAEMDAKDEARLCGGSCYAYPLFTQKSAPAGIQSTDS